MLILSCTLADPEEVTENVKLLSVERHPLKCCTINDTTLIKKVSFELIKDISFFVYSFFVLPTP